MAHVVAFRKTPSKPNVFSASRLSNRTDIEAQAFKSFDSQSKQQEKGESNKSVQYNADYANGSTWSKSHSNLFGSKPASVISSQGIKTQFERQNHEAPKFDVKGFEHSKKPGNWLT